MKMDKTRSFEAKLKRLDSFLDYPLCKENLRQDKFHTNHY